MATQRIFELLRTTVDKWNTYNAPRLAAALAYYALLSLSPLVVLAVLIAGAFLTHAGAQRQLVHEVSAIAGPAGVNALQFFIQDAGNIKTGFIAGLIALVVLFFGASGVLIELQDSLNTIWEASVERRGWREMIWQRFVAFGMVFTLGLLIVASLAADATVQLLGHFVSQQLLNFAASFVAISLLFSLLFKYVPDVEIRWRDVIWGATVTAGLFVLGREILVIYFQRAAVGSTYGTAGALVIFIAWVYYSAEIFLFGAILTRVNQLDREAKQPR